MSGFRLDACVGVVLGVACFYSTILADESISVVKSALVSLGDGDYCLSATRTNDLSMTHRSKTGNRKWIIKPRASEGESGKDLWPEDSASQKVSAIALARRKSGSILAVVKTVKDGKSFFWAIKLIQFDEAVEGIKELRPIAVLLSAGRPEEKILAVTGDINPPSFTVVTGVISETRPGQIECGSITFEWCGSVEDALTGQIVPEYPNRKAE